jgi:hypothetical protein
MTRRIALITTVLALVLAAPAGAQSGPFGPLPPAEPTPVATETPTSLDNGETSVGTIFLIGGALLAGFGVIGWFIMRDARRSLPSDERSSGRRLREEGPHKHQKHAKEKARAKTRAQKQARKAHRKR